MTQRDDAQSMRLTTPKDVADLLRLSEYQVREYLRIGYLPAYKVGRSWRISVPDFQQWLERHRHHPIEKPHYEPRSPQSGEPRQPPRRPRRGEF